MARSKLAGASFALLFALCCMLSTTAVFLAQAQAPPGGGNVNFDEASKVEVESGTVDMSDLKKHPTTDSFVQLGKSLWAELQERDNSEFQPNDVWQLEGLMSPPKKRNDDRISNMILRVKNINEASKPDLWVEVEYFLVPMRRTIGVIIGAWKVDYEYQRVSAIDLKPATKAPFRFLVYDDWLELAQEEPQVLVRWVYVFGFGCIAVSIGFFILAIKLTNEPTLDAKGNPPAKSSDASSNNSSVGSKAKGSAPSPSSDRLKKE